MVGTAGRAVEPACVADAAGSGGSEWGVVCVLPG